MILYLWIAHAAITFVTMVIYCSEHQCGYRPGWIGTAWLLAFNWLTSILLLLPVVL